MTAGNAQVITGNLPTVHSSIVCGPIPGVDFNGPHAIELWVRADNQGDARTIAELVWPSGTRRPLIHRVKGGIEAVGRHFDDDPVVPASEAPADPFDSDWHLYSWVFDGSTITFYVDALPQTQLQPIWVEVAGNDPPTLTVTGCAGVREVRVWASARQQTDIQLALFTCMAPQPDLVAQCSLASIPATDRSGNNVPIVLQGGANYREDTVAVLLTGSNPYVDCGLDPSTAFPGNASFTVETWCLPMSSLPTPARIFSWDGLNGGGYGLGMDAYNRVFGYRSGDAVWPQTPILVGEWVHLALTYDGQTLTLYINGVESGQMPSSVPPLPAVPAKIRIGGVSSDNVYFAGFVEEVRLWSECRSPAQIVEYMHRHPVMHRGIVAYWAFDFVPAADASGHQPDIQLLGGASIAPSTRYIPADTALEAEEITSRAEDSAEPLADVFADVLARIALSAEATQAFEHAREHLAGIDDRAAAFRAQLSGEEGGALSTPILWLETRDERLALMHHGPSGPELLAIAPDDNNEVLLWQVAVTAQSFQVLLSVFGIRLVSGPRAVRIFATALGNPAIQRAFGAFIAKTVTALTLIQLIADYHAVGLISTVLWQLAAEVTLLMIAVFLAKIATLSIGVGYVIIVAMIAVDLIVLALLIAQRWKYPVEQMTITMFQAQWGDSILVQYSYTARMGAASQNYSWLFDGGPSGLSMTNTIAPALPAHLNDVCCTHVDADHIFGLLTLFAPPPAPPLRLVNRLLFNVPNPPQREEIGSELWQATFDADGKIRPEVLALTEMDDDPRFILRSRLQGTQLKLDAQARGVPIVPIDTTSPPWTFGPLLLTYVGPYPWNVTKFNAGGQHPGSEIANRESIMMKFQSTAYPTLSLLMTGDGWDRSIPDTGIAPAGNQKTDIRGNPAQNGLRYLFLKVPHHGSALSEDQAFYNGCTAQYYLVSADNAHHPLPTFQALSWIVQSNVALRQTGYSIYCTNDTPAVRQLAGDPNLRPRVANYNLFFLNQGQPYLRFTIDNGRVTGVPVVNTEVTRL